MAILTIFTLTACQFVHHSNTDFIHTDRKQPIEEATATVMEASSNRSLNDICRDRQGESDQLFYARTFVEVTGQNSGRTATIDKELRCSAP